MKLFEFKPKLVSCLKNYSKETFMADLMAGIIVGIVALPLAIAFGIASGVSPEKGIITAIIAGFIISLLGGSKVQIGGPTGAFIVIIYGIIQQYGEAGLIVATLMAGVLLVLLGVFKLGAVIIERVFPIGSALPNVSRAKCSDTNMLFEMMRSFAFPFSTGIPIVSKKQVSTIM